jgi:hypothetical protein
MTSAHGQPRTHCQNCGAALTGPYCSQCGQHDVDYNRSFGHVLEDALEGFLHFDGKFLRSARYIFIRPGYLTNEFVGGRRVRYANPVRFYVFASFLFFAVNLLMNHLYARRAPVAPHAPALASVSVAGSHVIFRQMDPTEPSWVEAPLRIQTDPGDTVSAPELEREIWHLLPEALFVCVPLFALILKLAYLRSGRPYVEHLVFALHVQALTFLGLIGLEILGYASSRFGPRFEDKVGFAVLLGIGALVYRSFRTVYGEGRRRTLLRMALVGLAYGLVLVGVLAGVGSLSFLLMSPRS